MGVYRRKHPRTAVVFGAGGVLGAAWMTGALPALQERLPGPVGDVDIMLGTSAGSVLTAALRGGVSIAELIAYQRGEAIGALAGTGEVSDGRWPPPPRLRLGSPQLMKTALTAPHRIHPWVSASAWMPVGRGSHRALREMVHSLHSPGGPCDSSCPAWDERAHTWVVAVDYDSGRRVVFGREGAPKACLTDAVVASCSIPGWYEPALIGGRRYVDGGVRSSTSLSLLARAAVDEVCVLAPMASTVSDRPLKPHKRLERRVRAVLTFALMREVQALRAKGVKVTVLTPGPQDLAVMGANLMDPRRRGEVLEASLRTSPRALASAQAA